MHKYILIINALQRRLESIEVQVHISSSPLKSLADVVCKAFLVYRRSALWRNYKDLTNYCPAAIVIKTLVFGKNS